MEKSLNNNLLIILALMFCFIKTTDAATITGLQECQSIKNTTKKAECFDKQTQKIIKEETERKQREEIAKVDAEKVAAEEKKIFEDKRKIEKAQKLLQVVRRFQTRVQTGFSYRDYFTVLSDLKFESQEYIRQSGADFPEFTKIISTAIDYYDAAGKIWGYKFVFSFPTESACIPQQENFIKEILKEAYVPIKRCGESRCICSGFPISLALQLVWAKASQIIDAAEKVVQEKP